MDNTVSFTSKIKFVNPKTLNNISKGAKTIPFVPASKCIAEADKFCTFKIRTCVGGGAIIPHKQAKGFHIYDSVTNHANIKTLSDKITDFNPERALIIGSKDAKKFGYEYSQPNFQKLKELLSKKVKHVTYFEEHKHLFSESSFYYSKKKDTWYICTAYHHNQKNKDTYVNSPEKLLEAFKNINIAKGDQLYIGEEQILPKDFPHIFEITQIKPKTHIENIKSNIKSLFKNIKKFFYE